MMKITEAYGDLFSTFHILAHVFAGIFWLVAQIIIDPLLRPLFFWDVMQHNVHTVLMDSVHIMLHNTAMVYITQLASRIRTKHVASWSCSLAVSKPVWHIPLLRVQWKTPDDGQRNCPKHVEFYSKNRFEKLVHLVGFIIRIYHDARSSVRQISNYVIKSHKTK